MTPPRVLRKARHDPGDTGVNAPNARLCSRVVVEPNPRSSWMKISASGRGQFGPIWEMAYQHYVHRRGLPMPFTTRIVFGQKLSVVGRKQPCPYRPEPALPNTGICWGTLTAYRGKP